MTGGTIDIEGGTFNNTWTQPFMWTNNRASLNIAAGTTVDLYGNDGMSVDALTGSGTVTNTAWWGGPGLPLPWASTTAREPSAASSPTGRIPVASIIPWLSSRTAPERNPAPGPTPTAAARRSTAARCRSAAGVLGGGNYSAAIANNGALVMNTSSNQTFSGTISGLVRSTNWATELRLFPAGFPTRSATSPSNAASTLEFNTGTQQQLSGGTLSGNGTIVKSGAGSLLLGAYQTPQYISMSGGLIDVEGGLLRNEWHNGNWSANLSSLNVAAGATVDLWDSPGGITVDALTGAGTVQDSNASCTLTAGVNNGSGTFGGTIISGLSLVKTGSGVETFSGPEIDRQNQISGGTLQIGGGGVLGGGNRRGDQQQRRRSSTPAAIRRSRRAPALDR